VVLQLAAFCLLFGEGDRRWQGHQFLLISKVTC
jgi:hypothetical protein